MNDCLLKNVDYTKDLGIIVSHNLKWTDNVQMKLTKALRSFFIEAKDSMANPIRENIQSIFLTSVNCYFIWDPSWSPDMTRLKIMENYQKQCFK